MASNYPTSLDNFTNPTSNDSLNSPSHSLQHANINDAVEAIEAKLGIGASPAGSAVSGYVLTAGTGGTTTWSAPSIAGLTQIVPASITKGASGSASVSANGAVTFSGTESISFNGCFSSAYDNYVFIGSLTSASVTTTFNGRIRSGTTDLTTSTYWLGNYYTGSRSSQASGSNNNYLGNTFDLGQTHATVGNSFVLNVYKPFLTQYTQTTFHGSGAWFSIHSGTVDNTTSYDGWTFYPASGTITGTIRVYGYRNG